MKTVFPHEQLEVYQLAVSFAARATQLAERLPEEEGYLAEQIEQASLAIPVNIALGAGEPGRRDRVRCFSNALGAVFRCAGALDCCLCLRLLDMQTVAEERRGLARISGQLAALMRAGSRRHPL